MATAAPHQNILPRDRIDHSGDVLAREGISQAPKGTSILQAGRDADLPSFALIRANLMKSIIPDFQRGVQMREAEKHARPFRLTDVPAERFANAVRMNSGKNKNSDAQDRGVKSGYEAVDEHGTKHRTKAVMYEDTNYIGIANLQIYAFFGLTAAAGLGTVLILASLKKFPQLIFALPFAMFSGWQMYGYYLSTKAAADQASKVQYLRLVQGGLDDMDPERQTKFVKKPPPQPSPGVSTQNLDVVHEDEDVQKQQNTQNVARVVVSEEQLQADESKKIVLHHETKSDLKQKDKIIADDQERKFGNLKVPGRD